MKNKTTIYSKTQLHKCSACGKLCPGLMKDEIGNKICKACFIEIYKMNYGKYDGSIYVTNISRPVIKD